MGCELGPRLPDEGKVPYDWGYPCDAQRPEQSFRALMQLIFGENMEITFATVEDADTILALQRFAYQSEAAIYDDFTIPPLTETLADLKARFGDRRFLKAIEDGQIVGSVRAFQDGVTCHVERLIVHPDYRRRGIGTALLNEIETVFPNARRCELFTGHKSAGNIRLYQRLGYREFRREQVNEKVTLVYMEKAKVWQESGQRLLVASRWK